MGEWAQRERIKMALKSCERRVEGSKLTCVAGVFNVFVSFYAQYSLTCAVYVSYINLCTSLSLFVQVTILCYATLNEIRTRIAAPNLPGLPTHRATHTSRHLQPASERGDVYKMGLGARRRTLFDRAALGRIGGLPWRRYWLWSCLLLPPCAAAGTDASSMSIGLTATFPEVCPTKTKLYQKLQIIHTFQHKH